MSITEKKVAEQLRSMGADRYLISCIPEIINAGQRPGDVAPKKMKPVVHRWTTDDVIKNVPFLRAKNAGGNNDSRHHIFVVPDTGDADTCNLVFIDDIKLATIDRMKANGLVPACVIESSPGNAQAWIKLDAMLDTDIRRAVARYLQVTYDGDPRAVAKTQSGRLAGFVNTKWKYRKTDGTYPFVLLRASTGATTPAAPIIAMAEQYRLKQQAEAVQAVQNAGCAEGDPVVALKAGVRRVYGLCKAMDWTPDPSKIDYRAALEMLKAGFSVSDVAAAIEAAGPVMHTQRRDHDWCAYAAITAAKAAADK